MQLIGTGFQRAGKTSRITVGQTPLVFASYEATLNGDDYPTVNFESWRDAEGQTFDEGILGPIGADIRAGGDWDAHFAPLGSPPGLYPRDDLANLSFYTSRFDNVAWIFPFARIRSATNGSDVKGKVTFNFSGKNQGRFNWPTGNV